jgi:meiotically up-regulated gene 157 (Mug157) protein
LREAINSIVRSLVARSLAILCAIAALSYLPPERIAGQTLVVPMTGRRARDIQTAQLFHTLFHDFFLEDDATTYVQTGDIPAMWLRDSSAQTIPYIRYQAAYPVLRARFAGVIERDARNVLTDPYANALDADYHVWERKWEVDSPAWPVILTWIYWHLTADRTVFTPDLHRALQTIVATYRCEERHRTCSRYRYPYRVYTNDAYSAGTGLIWGAFRPSDDPVQYRFNIPQNAMAVVALRDVARLALDGYGDASLANQAGALGARVQIGVERYGRYFDTRRHDWMYAYETDGYGRYNLMDDANIPNLTTLPYIDWCSAFDPIYLATRRFTLSKDNPFFYSGRYAAGLGSPHTPYGYVWPLGIIGRALTATSSAEVAAAITTLAETDGENGLIHESFYSDGYWRYTRPEFGWANALGAELLFRSLAGDSATQFAWTGPIEPFERRSRTPTLVPTLVQIENAAELNATLGQLLHVTGGAIPHAPK